MFGMGLAISNQDPETLKNSVKVGLWIVLGIMAILSALGIALNVARLLLIAGQGFFVSAVGLIISYLLM